MVINYELPHHLQKQVDLGTPGTDILHGELKNLMYATELEMDPLDKTDNELEYLQGRLTALSDVYQLTYLLAFAIDDRSKND